MHCIAAHEAEHLFVMPTPYASPLVPKVLADIFLKLLLGWGMGECIGVAVTQHEPSDLKRIVKRGRRDGTWYTRIRKVEFRMKPHHSG